VTPREKVFQWVCDKEVIAFVVTFNSFQLGYHRVLQDIKARGTTSFANVWQAVQSAVLVGERATVRAARGLSLPHLEWGWDPDCAFSVCA